MKVVTSFLFPVYILMWPVKKLSQMWFSPHHTGQHQPTRFAKGDLLAGLYTDLSLTFSSFNLAFHGFCVQICPPLSTSPPLKGDLAVPLPPLAPLHLHVICLFSYSPPAPKSSSLSFLVLLALNSHQHREGMMCAK